MKYFLKLTNVCIVDGLNCGQFIMVQKYYGKIFNQVMNK